PGFLCYSGQIEVCSCWQSGPIAAGWSHHPLNSSITLRLRQAYTKKRVFDLHSSETHQEHQRVDARTDWWSSSLSSHPHQCFSGYGSRCFRPTSSSKASEQDVTERTERKTFDRIHLRGAPTRG